MFFPLGVVPARAIWRLEVLAPQDLLIHISELKFKSPRLSHVPLTFSPEKVKGEVREEITQHRLFMWDLEWPSIKDLIHKRAFLPQSASPACVHPYSCHYVNPVVSSSCLHSFNGKKARDKEK